MKLTETGTKGGTDYSAGDPMGIRQIGSTTTNAGNKCVWNEYDYWDLNRALPAGLDVFATATGTYLQPSFVFSMDDVKVNADGTAYWESGSMAATALPAGSRTATSGSKYLLSTDKFNSFVAPFMGGTDGTNIMLVDPFSSTIALDGKTAKTSYAYYSIERAIDLITDPEYIKFDVAAMPGITNNSLRQKLVNMSVSRADNLTILDANSGYIPSYDASGVEVYGYASQAISDMDARAYNSSYSACYYPPIRLGTDDGGVIVPASVAGIGVLAQSDAASGAPWFAPAGFNRGGLGRLGGQQGPSVVGAIENLTKADRDDLYESRINPIANFPGEGTVVFGQKTLQVKKSALDRINVRRLMIYLKKRVGKVAQNILFDNSVEATWTRFRNGAEPILADAQSRFGITEYKLVLDETTTTPDLIDRNILYAKIFVKPARAIEFIAIDFIISKTGVEF
jgi:hypothetical protein